MPFRNTRTGKLESLPWRIRMPDGSTRTDPAQWWQDNEARSASGYVESDVTPLDLTPVQPVVAASVSPRQLRIWLVTHGISVDAVDAAISAIPDATQRQIARIEWDYSPYYERNHPLLNAVAASLGLTEDDVDQAFFESALL